jgi:UDP:flavonoid glycosyltransferase YjiC (YdhE family)
MKITLYAIGTRGDVQPLLALAHGLRAAGHDLCFVAGANFEAAVTDQGMTFVPTVDIQALMQSPEGIAWVEEPNALKQLGHMRRLLNLHAKEMLPPLIEAAAHADLLLAGFVGEPFAISLGQKFGKPVITAALQPYRPTRSAAASLITPIPNRDSLLNVWLGKLGQRQLWKVAQDAVQLLREMLGLPPLPAGDFIARQNATPALFGFSPSVTPQPRDWPAHQQVTGYWFLDDPGWQPSGALAAFLAAGPAPVYVGFGSMTGSDPQQTFAIVQQALREAGQRGIISTGWSGAEADAASGGDMFALDAAPHDWLFPRMAAVVHHGGAGTTAAGLRAGRPTLIIPHLGDQPYWGRRVQALGVGPKPVPRHILTEKALAHGIRQLAHDAALRARAEALGERIRAEDGIARAVACISQWMGG